MPIISEENLSDKWLSKLRHITNDKLGITGLNQDNEEDIKNFLSVNGLFTQNSRSSDANTKSVLFGLRALKIIIGIAPKYKFTTKELVDKKLVDVEKERDVIHPDEVTLTEAELNLVRHWDGVSINTSGFIYDSFDKPTFRPVASAQSPPLPPAPQKRSEELSTASSLADAPRRERPPLMPRQLPGQKEEDESEDESDGAESDGSQRGEKHKRGRDVDETQPQKKSALEEDIGESLSQAVKELESESQLEDSSMKSDSATFTQSPLVESPRMDSDSDSGPITQDLSLSRFASDVENVYNNYIGKYAMESEETPTQIADVVATEILYLSQSPDDLVQYGSAHEQTSSSKATEEESERMEEGDGSSSSVSESEELSLEELELNAIKDITNALCNIGERGAPVAKNLLIISIRGIWSVIKLAYNHRSVRMIIILLLLIARHKSGNAKLLIDAIVMAILRFLNITLRELFGVDIKSILDGIQTWAIVTVNELTESIKIAVTDAVTGVATVAVEQIKDILKEFAEEVKGMVEAGVTGAVNAGAFTAVRDSFLDRMGNYFATGVAQGTVQFAARGIMGSIMNTIIHQAGGPLLTNGAGPIHNTTRKNKSKPKKNYRKTQHNKKKKVTRRKHNKHQPKKRTRRIK